MMVCKGSQPLNAMLCRSEGGLHPLNDLFVLDTNKLQWVYPKLAGGARPSPGHALHCSKVFLLSLIISSRAGMREGCSR